MIAEDFIIIEANDINVYLSEKIDYDAFIKTSAVNECYVKGNTIHLYTTDTDYLLCFNDESDAKSWYIDFMNQIITDTSA